MMLASLVWGSPEWLGGALALGALAAIVLLANYWRAPTTNALRWAAASLKAVALAALALCLLEPLLTGTKPRQGANAFVLLADNSQSMRIGDGEPARPRGEWLQRRLVEESEWRTRLGQDFDVRNYVFDSHLRAVADFQSLDFEGQGSSLGTSLATIEKRFEGLPLAGVLLFTDGNGTDVQDFDSEGGPPIFPVLPPSQRTSRDVRVQGVSVSQTNFETAPVEVRAEVAGEGFSGQQVVAALVDENGREIERQRADLPSDGKPASFRFQLRPEQSGVSFYRVRTAIANEANDVAKQPEERRTTEQTLANNDRMFVVDRGGGPYRVLYVSGRPNWEFKFLHRAVQDDDDVNMVGLLRIARRQPKFVFRSADVRGQNQNQLFDGFEHPDDETAERQDEPVLVRVDTVDGEELRDGFPQEADELYRYHAVILDDIEAEFFTQDQLTMLRSFVNQRGGGLLMLGGPDSFAAGKYDRTPVGELLPVYLDRANVDLPAGDVEYQLALTREGWLQPWVRTRETEDQERRRLETLPNFKSISRAGTIKPGAAILAELRGEDGVYPGLVAQNFGKGRSAALLVGDYWRWNMHRDQPEEDDFDRAWRQTVRWLVSDVPGRLEVDVKRQSDSAAPAMELAIRVRDPEYLPLDNAQVKVTITDPAGKTLELAGEPADREAGLYTTTYVSRQTGAYRATITATAPDGGEIAAREAGWTAQPAAEEFARLAPNRELLASIAAKSGGELVEANELASFVAGLSRRKAPITEPWIYPLWHHPMYFLVALTCLAAEWGLRRWHGLA